jgi:hypothetical protein
MKMSKITFEFKSIPKLDSNILVEGEVPAEKLPELGSRGALWLEGPDVGGRIPCQFTRKGDRLRLKWIGDRPIDRKVLSFSFVPMKEEDRESGVKLIDQPRNGRLMVFRGKRLITIYNYHPHLFKPYFFPVIGPAGKNVTEDRPADHIHHHSIWFGGEINGCDVWLERGENGRVVHRRFHLIESGPVFGRALEENVWISGEGRELVEEEREFSISAFKDGSWILDISTRLRASFGDAIFSNTKEAGYPHIRVADIIDELDGGVITSSKGDVGESATFGKRYEWVDYSGPIARDKSGKAIHNGIAMFDSSENPFYPNPWFTRSYGLLCGAEPFHFLGSYTLPAGGSLKLKYRILIHDGDVLRGRVAEQYGVYRERAGVSVE